jgi:replicative DNA helicase
LRLSGKPVFLKMRQQIIQTLSTIVTNQAIDDDEIIHQLKQLIDNNTSITLQQDNIVKTISELCTENIENWNGNPEDSSLIKTHFRELDELVGGFMPGEFVVIGARPSMGKTQLLINLALNMSKSAPVLYCSLDLSEYQLTSRFLSTLSNVPIQNILLNNLTAAEKDLIVTISKQLSQYHIYINGSSLISLSAFRDQCIKQIMDNGVKIIVVDFIQQINLKKFRSNREQEISNFSHELKNIAKENNVVVIATSQLSRSVETRKESKVPQLSDLRDSGSIEQDADKVVFMYRPEYYGINNNELGEALEGETHLCVAKNRFGKMGSVKLFRALNGTTFCDMDDSSSSLYDGGGFRNNFTLSQSRINEILK